MDVVCAILIQKGRFLLGKRSLTKEDGGLWEFPGGKVKTQEGLNQALVRELEEELLLKVSPDSLNPLGKETDGTLTLHFFLHFLSHTMSPQEHQALGWFELKDITHLSLCNLDQRACEIWKTEIEESLKKSLT